MFRVSSEHAGATKYISKLSRPELCRHSRLGSLPAPRRIFMISLALMLIALLAETSCPLTALAARPSGAEEDLTIVEVYSSDSTGKSRASYRVGENLLIWVAVRNDGADLDLLPRGPVVWIELDYVSDDVPFPVGVQFSIQRLPGGGTVIRWGAGFYLNPTNLQLGDYEAHVYISDAMISDGGKFYNASMTSVFTVTGA